MTNHATLFPDFQFSPSADARRAIAGLATLRSLDGWTPRRSDGRWMNLLEELGLSRIYTKDIRSLEGLTDRIVDALLRQEMPPRSDVAELACAAVMRILGASQVSKIGRQESRTPDLLACWDENEVVEVEVTRADQKEWFTRMDDLLRDVAVALHNVEIAFDLVLHLSPDARAEHIPEIITAARFMQPGRACEAAPIWHLTSSARPRGPLDTVQAGSSDARPDWWIESDVTVCNIRQTVATRNAAAAPPQVRVWASLRARAYLNPIEGKAARAQSSGRLPFLVAVDVSRLPNAFAVIGRQISSLWERWPSVSGVLVFRFTVSSERLGWNAMLLPNPAATRPLSERLRALDIVGPWNPDRFLGAMG